MNKRKTSVNSEKINWSSNQFVDKTKSVITFKIINITSSLKDLSPYSRMRQLIYFF